MSSRKSSCSAHLCYSSLEQQKMIVREAHCPKSLKSSFSSCYSPATCIWALVAAGIGWPLFPAYLLSSLLLATTATTWLTRSDSRSCPNRPAAAATRFPPPLSFPTSLHQPCSAGLAEESVIAQGMRGAGSSSLGGFSV